MRETELYGPIKAFLEAQGYEVKSEVGAADVMACRDGDPPLIVELKTGFSLALFHQAVARQALTDAVYVAVPKPGGKPGSRRALRDNLGLARRLGLGVIVVRPRDRAVEVLADPGPFRPRALPARRARLLREFARREGDPNTGGATRAGIVTTYRQDALRCLAHLAAEGPSKGAEVARATGVPNARRIMADDHYGWFERVERGVYGLTPNGLGALKEWAKTLQELAAA